MESLGFNETGSGREIPVTSLEAAVLDRTRTQQRKFKRLTHRTLQRVLGR